MRCGSVEPANLIIGVVVVVSSARSARRLFVVGSARIICNACERVVAPESQKKLNSRECAFLSKVGMRKPTKSELVCVSETRCSAKVDLMIGLRKREKERERATEPVSVGLGYF